MPAAHVSPIVAALDHPEVTLNPDTVPVAALSLVDAFGEVPDPRKARGIRHGVAAILLLGACAVLTGARSFAAIGEYAHDTGRTILDRLGVGAVVPHACTIRRVLQDLDPAAVEAAMRSWALAQLAQTPPADGIPAPEQRQVLAVDGKTVRGAHLRIDRDDETGATTGTRMGPVTAATGSRIWCRCSTTPAARSSPRSRSRRKATRSARSPRCSTTST